MSSIQCTRSGFGSTSARSRLTTTGSWPLRTTTQDTNTSNTYNPTFYDCATEVCSDFCATGGDPCTAPSYCQCH